MRSWERRRELVVRRDDVLDTAHGRRSDTVRYGIWVDTSRAIGARAKSLPLSSRRISRVLLGLIILY